MPKLSTGQTHAGLFGLLIASLLTVACTLIAPPSVQADIKTFGNPLTGAATLDTAENLDYQGTDTHVPASPEAPNGVVHTYHFGADAALWNASVANGTARAPATGQALKVSLEGCAVPAADGPPPLTQIHFQDVTPQPDGGAKINITSQAFDIPVCGVGGASGSTVSTYEPINLCVSAGDYVALNEEGGFVEHSYQSGVRYQVLGSVPGSTLDSFIKGGGTNNGTSMSPSDSTAMDGFASTRNEELMMRVTLGTHADATHICPGGRQGLPPALAPIRIGPQTDGVNHSRIAAVAIFCRPINGCAGVATLTPTGRAASKSSWGRTRFSVSGGKTAHVPIRVPNGVIKLLRRHRAAGMRMTLSVVFDGRTFSQTITLKIF